MMSDVLTQPQAHSTPPPGPNPAELNHSLEDRGGGGVAVGGGVPIRGRAITPSHERLQRRMSGYRSDAEKAYSHLNATANALNHQHMEDTEKLKKKFVENNKPKKTTKNKSSSNHNDNTSSKVAANNMKPQIQQANGLKRPHPGANTTSSSTSDVLGGSAAVNSAATEAKRMNLDQNVNNATAIKLEVKQDAQTGP